MEVTVTKPIRGSLHIISNFRCSDFLIQIFYQSGKNEEKEPYITFLRTKRGQRIWRDLKTCLEHTTGNTLTLFKFIALLGSRPHTDPRPGRAAAHSRSSRPARQRAPPALLPATPRSWGGGATEAAPCRPALEPRPAAARGRKRRAAAASEGGPSKRGPLVGPSLYSPALFSLSFLLQLAAWLFCKWSLRYQTLMMSLPLRGPMERQRANHHQQPWMLAPLSPTSTSPKRCNLLSLHILTSQQAGAKDGKERASKIL